MINNALLGFFKIVGFTVVFVSILSDAAMAVKVMPISFHWFTFREIFRYTGLSLIGIIFMWTLISQKVRIGYNHVYQNSKGS